MVRSNDRGKPDTLRIGDVARQADVTADTLRYYERLGLIEPAGRTSGGYRSYESGVVDRLQFIGKAQALGLTLEEILEVLRVSAEGTPPCEHVRSTLAQRLRDVDARLAELRALRRALSGALDRSAQLPPAASCVCGIIESRGSPPANPVPAQRRRGAIRGTRKERPR